MTLKLTLYILYPAAGSLGLATFEAIDIAQRRTRSYDLLYISVTSVHRLSAPQSALESAPGPSCSLMGSFGQRGQC